MRPLITNVLCLFVVVVVVVVYQIVLIVIQSDRLRDELAYYVSLKRFHVPLDTFETRTKKK